LGSRCSRETRRAFVEYEDIIGDDVTQFE
jgi:hypothetical protein